MKTEHKDEKKGSRDRPKSECYSGFPVVGIGASAGGFDAFKKFFTAMAADSGMAFVLIQHLDPTHHSLTEDLLARHTPMKVIEAEEKMSVEANHVYVIPPGKYLTIKCNVLHLSEPIPSRGMRMPIDYFFRSLAEDQGEKAICMILSGTGTDGTLGLKAIKSDGGMSIAQTPETAQYDGMPRSAMGTGLVDYVRPVEEMPHVLIKYIKHFCVNGALRPEALMGKSPGHLHSVLDILRTRTRYDFRCYKKGTLVRRIGRRMGLIHTEDMKDYVSYLRENPEESTLLFKGLLIGVTGFFREPTAFKVLAEQVFRPLVQHKTVDTPLRIWVPGCASGEEPYSISMLLTEELRAQQKTCPLQIFATDIDEEALAVARAGRYPENISADVSAQRLRLFFNKKGDTFEVSKQVRESVVYAVQNLIGDAPFSKLDLISCRNLLIYLELSVQRKLITMFHFALNEDGYLFLGSAETIGQHDDLFEPVSKRWRVYRRIGPVRRPDVDFPILFGQGKATELQAPPPLLSDLVQLGELTKQQLLRDYAPASVLVNRKQQILYYFGATDQYMRQPTGGPTDDLIARCRQGLSTKLRAALGKAMRDGEPVTLSDARVRRDSGYHRVLLTVNPLKVPREAIGLFLIIFQDQPEISAQADKGQEIEVDETSLVQQLEYELKTAREELQTTTEEQDSANEELKAANEEVMSVNEELQSTNEELETSKEELQSLNEELTTVNSQLQDKVGELEQSNNDLDNLLSSTDIATIFLDAHCRIKRYTPTTTRLLSLISTDVGRPISDIAGKFHDHSLFEDAQVVLDKLIPREKEVRTDNHTYLRRILPYRTEDNRIDGVVITFVDITERKRAERALLNSKAEADKANRHKSRFLATASHDLRQPLQTLNILTGILTEKIKDPELRDLVQTQRRALRSMEGLMEAFLNISKLEAGAIEPKLHWFRIQGLLERTRGEFDSHARDKGLSLRLVPCAAMVRSDPTLLERILQNFVSNAIKHTDAGKVLMGCRRRGKKLRIEVWDTGVGIPQDQLRPIFEEFYQLDNTSREDDKGLGLGLSIVDRLARLLGHSLDVRSTPGRGSMFALELPLGVSEAGEAKDQLTSAPSVETEARQTLTNTNLLIIDDDTLVLKSLRWGFETIGAQVITDKSGVEALAKLQAGGPRPDVIIADYRLPGGENGIQVIQRLREISGHDIPAILLSGDTSEEVIREIKKTGLELAHKPTDIENLTQNIRRLLKGTESADR